MILNLGYSAGQDLYFVVQHLAFGLRHQARFAQCQADVGGRVIALAIAIVTARILMNSSLSSSKKEMFQLSILPSLKLLSADSSLKGGLWR